MVSKYGADRVSEIITFDFLKARAAVKDTGRALGVPYALCDQITKHIDPRNTIAEAMAEKEDGAELRKLYETDSSAHQLLDMAMQLEGMPRHASTHAAGVLISAFPIVELVPLQKNDNIVITQYPMKVLEKLGLLKFDFLGLRNLSIIHDCVLSIQKQQPAFSLDKISLHDSAVYAMMSKGDTTGVFQFESAGMRSILKRLRPQNLVDLTIALSLYRPGPRSSIDRYLVNRQEPEKITYAHPLLEPILRPTYGCMIYQEQVMEICRVLSGYSYGRADTVRHAMSKKMKEEMERERQVFIYGCDGKDGTSPCCGAVANGVPAETANAIFDEISAFASYAFNKSHAVAYATLAYQTAYLKCHYFAEYMAALLTSVMGETEKVMEYLSACQSAGVEVLPPHVNRSGVDFLPQNHQIQFGMLAVRNLGRGFLEAMVQERSKAGAFTGLQDFCRRMLPLGLNRQALDSLICCGALDELGLNRQQMRQSAEQVMAFCRDAQNRVMTGQMNLFGGADDSTAADLMQIPYVAEYSAEELMQLEHDSMGFYFSSHPLQQLDWLGRLLHVQQAAALPELPDNASVFLLVTLQNVRKHTTRQGGSMCFLTCEDRTGTADCVVFSNLYPDVRSKLKRQVTLWIRGKITQKEERVSVRCESILTTEEIRQLFPQSRLCFKLPSTARDAFQKIAALSAKFPGKVPVCFYLTDQKRTVSPKVPCMLALTETVDAALCRIVPAERIGLLLPPAGKNR